MAAAQTLSDHHRFAYLFGSGILKVLLKSSIYVFFSLSVAIILFPFHYFFGFSQVEGLNVIEQPLVFSLIFDCWVLFAFTSFYSAGEQNRRKIETTLVIVFASVSGLLTLKMIPLGTDHSYDITLYGAAYLANAHSFAIPPPVQVGYLEYPGIMLITYISSSLLSTSLLNATELLQVFLYIVMGLVVFGVTKLLVHNSLVSSISLPLFFAFSIESGNLLLFFPAALGATLLALSFLFVARTSIWNAKILFLMALLFVAMIITHFYDPLNLILVLIFIYVGTKQKNSRALSFFILFAIGSFTVYFSHFAMSFFNSVVPQSLYSFLRILSEPSQNYALQVVSANTFGVPWWVAVTKYIDVTFTSIIGSAIAVHWFLRARKNQKFAGLLATKYSAASVGIIVFGIIILISTLGSGGKSADFYAALQWVVYFSIPMFLLAIARNRSLLTLFLIMIAILSAPSLLALVTPQISTIAVYPENIASASFLVNHSSSTFTVRTDGKNAGVIGSFNPMVIPNYYTIPASTFQYESNMTNVVDTRYSFYQLHLYGFPINYSTIYDEDIIYNVNGIYILPP
jgi:hypothetical protein